MDKLDKLDVKILNLLQVDASLAVKDIANKVGLSVSPTYDRINRLKKEGFIEKYVALVNREKLGKQLLVLCTVTLKEQSVQTLTQFETDIVKFKEVMEVMCLAGGSDYLLKIAANDVNDYHKFVVTQLSIIPNISNLSSSFVLKEIKRETTLNID